MPAYTLPSQKNVDAKALMKKWDKWLRGVNNGDRRATLALLLENQFNYNRTKLLTEATAASDAGAFQKVILPVIRRVFPRLVAPELVGVQPMTGPTGLVIFLKYLYESVTGSPTEILQPQGNVDGRRIGFNEFQSAAYLHSSALVSTSAPAYTVPLNVNTSPGGNTWQSFTGAAQVYFDVTLTNASNVGRAVIIGTNTAPYTASAPSWTFQILKQYNSSDPVSYPATIQLTTVSSSAALTGTVFTLFASMPAQFTNNASLALTMNSGSVSNVLTLNPITFPGEVSTAAAVLMTDAVFLNNGCPLLTSYALENQSPANIGVTFETHPIVAEDYKLQATWSLEAQQDVSALHNESLEEILSNLLTQELLNQIDYLVVRDLYNMAALSATWNKFPGTQTIATSAHTAATDTSYAVPTSAPAYRGSTKEWWETLVFLMNDIANSIHTRILRGPANFAVCDPSVSTILESLPDFKIASMNEIDSQVGIVPVGSMSGKYKVYKDARLPKGTLLMGYKGDDMRNTGYAYCPYIPATLTPVIWDPTTYANKRMILTRFGRATLLDGQFFYARIGITESNLATSDWTSV